MDPEDYGICPQTPEQLISAAAELDYHVLAITCHNKDIWTESLSDFARNLGVTLIPGMEVSADQGRHVLVYNFHTGRENLNSLQKIRERRREDTLVVAPHAFFPGPACLGRLLERNVDIFDAIECSGFQIRGLDFNRRSTLLARISGKTLIGCGDIHYLWQLNKTATWIYAEPGIHSIVSAIKRGDVKVEICPITWPKAAEWWLTRFWRYVFPVNPDPSRSAPQTVCSPARR
jgi:hypothetical protein